MQNPCEFDLKLNNGAFGGAILLSPSSKLYSVVFGEIPGEGTGGQGRGGDGRAGEGRGGGEGSDLFNFRFSFRFKKQKMKI